MYFEQLYHYYVTDNNSNSLIMNLKRIYNQNIETAIYGINSIHFLIHFSGFRTILSLNAKKIIEMYTIEMYIIFPIFKQSNSLENVKYKATLSKDI